MGFPQCGKMAAILAAGAAASAPASQATEQVTPAIAPVPAAPAALIKDNRVVHPTERVGVRVPASAVYVGSERFNLYGVADAEIHVFAEADASRRVQKLYWIQFESILPGNSSALYNYADGNTRFGLWGASTWLHWGPQRMTATRPGSDREHVIGLLTRAGYAVPPEMMSVRLVQMLDDPQGTGRGRKELMLIYGEDLAPSGRSFAELMTNGELTPLWTPLEKPLVERATSAFAIERP